MIRISKSLIRFRNAAGVMLLAVAAIFAVVISTISMPGDRALGQTASMTNSAKVQAALDALESARGYTWSSGAELFPPIGGVGARLQDVANRLRFGLNAANDPTVKDVTLSVDWLDSNFRQREPAVTVDDVSFYDAQRFTTPSSTVGTTTGWLLYHVQYIRHTVPGGDPFGYTPESVQLAAIKTALDDIADGTTTISDGTSTPASLSDEAQGSLKTALDGIYNALLASNEQLTAAGRMPADYLTMVKQAIVDAASLADSGITATITVENVTIVAPGGATFDALFNATPDPDTGTLVNLQTIRGTEARVVEAAKKVYNAMKVALEEYEFTPLPENATEAEKTARAAKEMVLKTAREDAAPLLAIATAEDDQFNALDELAALETALANVGVPSSGVTMKRLDAIEIALLKNNSSFFDGERAELKGHSLNYIIAALDELSDLDGTDAQMMAMAALEDVLTKVDDLHTAAMPLSSTDGEDPDINDNNLSMKEVDAFNNVEAKFNALQTALANRHIDTAMDTGDNTAGVDADIAALLELDNDGTAAPAGSSPNNTDTVDIRTNVAALATALTTQLGEDDGATPPVPTAAATALLTELETGILASAVSDTDLEVTTEELADALGLAIDTSARTAATTEGTADGDSTEDTMGTDDFGATLDALVTLDDDLREVNETTAIAAVITALETLSSNAETEIEVKLLIVRSAAASYRTASLQYDALAAMAALQDALNDLANDSDGGVLDEEVRIAREALIAAYENRQGLTAEARAEIEAAYLELISKGSTQHAFAQKAALLELKSALDTDGDDSEALVDAIETALTTESPEEQQAQAMISRIEPGITDVTVSGGDNIRLLVRIYGRQDLPDQTLAYGTDGKAGTSDDVKFDWGSASSDTGPSISYTAPNSPGMHKVTASLDSNECYHANSDEQMEKCTATFEIRVRRPSAEQEPDPAPQNPPGDIPELLADDGGNQYAVFTPEEGGTFDAGEGYSITAAAGAVPNNEFIGIRMSDGGAASNAGMTHQRYTLGGNMYGVHAVDSSSQAVSSYVLDDPATVCVPLPAELSQNISDLAVVAINGDDSLTILSAQVRISAAGTMVCGGLSNLPASVAVGSAGAPAAIPTPMPEPTPVAPETGGTAPASSAMVLWALLLGVAALALGSVLVIGRRRASMWKSEDRRDGSRTVSTTDH